MKSYFLPQFLGQVLQSVLTELSILKDCPLIHISFDKISELSFFIFLGFFLISIFLLRNNTC